MQGDPGLGKAVSPPGMGLMVAQTELPGLPDSVTMIRVSAPRLEPPFLTVSTPRDTPTV